MILVTIGTNEQPFDRLVRAAATLDGLESLVVQHGSSRVPHGRGEWVDFVSFEELSARMEQARVVVCHAGVGSIMLARRCGKRPIVVPRRLHLDEAVDDHQLPIARRLHANGVVTLLEDVDRLEEAISAVGSDALAQPLVDDSERRNLAGDLREYLARPGGRVNWARLFGFNKPNVKALARDGDIDGLVEAAHYREVVRRVDGRVSDAGAAVREAAILALRETEGDRAAQTLVGALGDPADRVRCAAIMALYERGDDDSLALAAAHLRGEDGQALATAFRALLELQKPGSTHKLVSAIVHREDERPMSEVDASIVRELLDAEGAGAGEVVDLLISALGDPREDVAERAEDLLELLAPESVEPLVLELRQRAGT